jgi:hemerythrin
MGTYQLWSDKLSIGVPHIDEHHKTLLNLLYKTRVAIETHAERGTIREILTELLSYTKYHFAAEERLMRECGFPKLNEQKADHGWFVDQLENSLLVMKDDTMKVSMDTFAFIKDWYLNHIIGSDLLIKDYLEKNKKSTTP